MPKYIDGDYLINIAQQIDKQESDALEESQTSLDPKEALKKWAIAYAACVTAAWINRTPATDVVPVIHAHWDYRYNSCDGTVGQAICSNCGNISFDGCSNGSGYFCPHCGAKMDEEEKNV